MKILYLGDVVGKIGLNVLKDNIRYLREKYQPNLIFINGENISDGRGLILRDYKEVMKLNIPLITMGNHTFHHVSTINFIGGSNIIRPYNLDTKYGVGYKTIRFNNKSITLINLLGQFGIMMKDKINNPFKAILELLPQIKSDYIIVDMHAESTSEKEAMAALLDGKVDAVLGTHTHVQTNDAQVLPRGLMYITDLGMCGSYDSVLGVKAEIILNRYLEIDNQAPFVFEDKGRKQINGVLLDMDKKSIKIVNEIFK